MKRWRQIVGRGTVFALVTSLLGTTFSLSPASAAAPTLSSSTPAHNATNIAVGANLVLTFSENVFATNDPTGLITLTPLPAGTPISATNYQVGVVTIATNTVTVNPPADLSPCTTYTVAIAANAFKNGANENFAGISAGNLVFTTAGCTFSTVLDVNSSTANGSYRAGGGTDPSIQVRFNQNVTVAGTPRLALNSGVGAVATYVSGSGTNTLTFSYTIGAGHSTMDQPSKKLNVVGIDLNGGSITGVSAGTPVPPSGTTGSLNLNKTIVIDNAPPIPQSLSPFPGAVGVGATQQLVLRFPEKVAKVDGKKIFIKRAADNVIHETITISADNTAVTNSDAGGTVVVTRAGKVGTVNLVTTPATGYYIEAEAGAIADLAGNLSGAISGNSTWSFTASPDLVPPSFLPNASDPPHNFGSFLLDRNIQLTFNEAVTPVTGKTIKLCTGAAACGTPVETFTLPSDRVTSGTGGLQVVIDPTASFTASTTYFLLIDAGAFVDGAENATASAVTAGQYQFTTLTPGAGGGGGGGTSCGPPPLPPCFINPTLMIGPGGMIQNPGAIGGADMANLRPDNFTGFRPQDAKALPPDAMQNFRPDQFGALPPQAMQGFRPEQITNLNPAALSGMNFQQVKALPPQAMQGFRPDQFAQLPPSAMAGFDPARMQALPPAAMAGFRPEQMAALPPDAMRGFDPTKMTALPPAALQGLDPSRLAALPPQAMSVMNPSQFGSVPPAAIEGMRFIQMTAIPPTAMQGFRPDQFGALPPDVMQAFKPQQMAALPPTALSGMEPEQMRALPPSAARVLNPQQMTALPPNALAAIPPGVFKALSPLAVAALTPEQRAALPAAALNPPPLPQAPNANNIAQIVGAISGWNIDKVPPAAFTGMRPSDLAKLPNDAFTALSPAQIGAMAASAMQAIKPAQLSALPPEAMAGFKPSQLGALPAQVFGAMSPAQVAALPPQVLGVLRPTQVGQLPPDAFEAMKPNQVSALPPSAVQAIKPEQLSAMPPEAIAGLKPNQFGALPPKALSAIEPEQVAALPPAAVSAIKPAQLGAIPADAFGEMKPTQVAALPPAAVQAIKPEQLAALPPDAMSGMKPAQVGALPPKALSAIEPEQIDAMSAQSLKQVNNKQLAALPTSAMQALDTNQIGAMPSTAFKGMKPEQAQALTPEQARAFDPKDLAQMPAAVRTIVNNARS